MEDIKQLQFEESSSILNVPNTLKRRGRKCGYKRLSNQVRQKLIEMVYLNDFSLKDAAVNLGINYSTAKTIIRIFRIEKRIGKKNTDDEKELKKIVDELKTISNRKNLSEKKLNNAIQSKFLTYEDTNDNIMNKNSTSPIKKCCDNFKAIQTVNDTIESFAKKIIEFKSTLNICHNEVMTNQILLNNLLGFFGNNNQQKFEYPAQYAFEYLNFPFLASPHIPQNFEFSSTVLNSGLKYFQN